jgi:hypothetical protein
VMMPTPSAANFYESMRLPSGSLMITKIFMFSSSVIIFLVGCTKDLSKLGEILRLVSVTKATLYSYFTHTLLLQLSLNKGD